jgi:hypothetical protein
VILNDRHTAVSLTWTGLDDPVADLHVDLLAEDKW